MDVVQADLAHRFATLGCIPRQIQTDRHPCFLGAAEPSRAALPGRFTLWLVGLGIGHRLIPVRRPQRNGAVERFHGAVERSWRGEAGGLAALIAVWNAERPPLSRRPRRYRGRAGFAMPGSGTCSGRPRSGARSTAKAN
jgi:transposase InsO family protein